jgi:hypothetical protein
LKVPVIVFLQELLKYQGKIGQHYADGLDGCGLELESKVREAYYSLMRALTDAIRGTARSSLQGYDFLSSCGLNPHNVLIKYTT